MQQCVVVGRESGENRLRGNGGPNYPHSLRPHKRPLLVAKNNQRDYPGLRMSVDAGVF